MIHRNSVEILENCILLEFFLLLEYVQDWNHMIFLYTVVCMQFQRKSSTDSNLMKICICVYCLAQLCEISTSFPWCQTTCITYFWTFNSWTRHAMTSDTYVFLLPGLWNAAKERSPKDNISYALAHHQLFQQLVCREN
jgi:hypothetical protein